MEKMILNKNQFTVNRILKLYNKSCNLGLRMIMQRKEYILMFRAERCPATPTEIIILN